MRLRLLSLGILIVFVVGFLSGMSLSVKNSGEIDLRPIVLDDNTEEKADNFMKFSNRPAERSSPYDWIKENQIKVYRDRVVIDIDNPQWATFTDTNSMDPIIDIGTNAIEIIPEKEEDIHIGDIVSYNSKYAEGTIIHRVVDISEDEDGWYAVMKGDNNTKEDPGKIRFEQIRRIVIGVIY